MRLITTIEQLRDAAASLDRRSGLGGVLVPTMGALHEGHASLIRFGVRMARERHCASGCTVSIFVNPTQFNDPADLARYPRTLAADLAVCNAVGAMQVFAPEPNVIYPPPPGMPVQPPPLPDVATRPGLEDAHRPGHFAGVCQVVKRLFELLEPSAAVFGEKDWQQLQVIKAMTRENALPVEIISFPTVREPTGLAMSSRNRFLSPEEREAALALSRALERAGAQATAEGAETAMREVLDATGLRCQYAVVRDAETLGPVSQGRPARALIAAWAGATRLIDNAPWPLPAGTPALSGKL